MFKRRAIVGVVVALVVLAVAPAAAGPKGTDRPFKADLVGEVTFEFGAAYCAEVAPVLTVTESWGNATHMGRVQADWAHCPLDVGFTRGELTMVAANRDVLYLEYENLTPGLVFPLSIVGGTGTFDGATGSVVVDANAVPVFLPDCEIDPTDPLSCLDFVTPWPWWASIEGTISY